MLLRPQELGFSVKAGATYQALFEAGALEQPVVDLALADAFDERRRQNLEVVDWLARYLTLSLIAPALEAVGLAAGAALSY